MRANYEKPKTPYKFIEDANKKYHKKITRRLMMATALTLSDICGFGNVRINRVMKGLSEIIDGYAVYSHRMNKDMAKELSDRGIVLPGITDVEDPDAVEESEDV
jgi:hypothetical protein